jgi:C-terminal processing protease CtpA/Prc
MDEMKKYLVYAWLLMMFCTSCRMLRSGYLPEKKYDKASLVKDFQTAQQILEKKHPSLYWYCSKQKMDTIFSSYEQQIGDSMTDNEFQWTIMAPVLHEIRCGHTTIRKSKSRERWEKNKKFKSFPLALKLWNDTLAVVGSYQKKDTLFKKGELIKAINGIPARAIVDKMKQVLSLDGYAENVNVVRIGNNFPMLHRYLFGLSEKYEIQYIDRAGETRTDSVTCFNPSAKDSTVKKLTKKKDGKKDEKKIVRPSRIERLRNFKIDSTGTFGTMTLTTFSNGRLRKFFKQTFKEIEEKGIKHLVLDVRSNGGGKVNHSTLLTKYVSQHSFKVADSVYSISRTLRPFFRKANSPFFTELFYYSLAYKKMGKKYHLRRLEKKQFKPIKKYHFDGQLYILTHGPSFSATTLFCNVVKGQSNVKLIGEETGGGWYGNSGILIPDFILPATKLRLRMPLFRVVQSGHQQERFGKGIIPDVEVGYSLDALLQGRDLKMEKAKALIIESTDSLIQPVAAPIKE